MSTTITITTTTSPLRLQTTAPSTITPTRPVSPLVASPLRRKTMSVTQTYFLAHKARAKLSQQAARPDHNLRLLVGHANLLDSLMLDLADAEREQESWFNQSVRGASSPKTQNRHVQWADAVVEEPEADWQAEDVYSDSSSDEDDSDSDEEDIEEDVEMVDAAPLRRVASHQMVPTLQSTQRYDGMEEEEQDDDEEDYAQLALTRSPSHSTSPPELDHDSDSSEDESMPPSPPSAVLPTFADKDRKSAAVGPRYYDSTHEEHDKDAFYDDGFYLPPRNPARLVSAISVY